MYTCFDQDCLGLRQVKMNDQDCLGLRQVEMNDQDCLGLRQVEMKRPRLPWSSSGRNERPRLPWSSSGRNERPRLPWSSSGRNEQNEISLTYITTCLSLTGFLFSLLSHTTKTTTWKDPRRYVPQGSMTNQSVPNRAAPFFTPQASLPESPAMNSMQSGVNDAAFRRSTSLIDPRGTRSPSGGSAMLQQHQQASVAQQQRQMNEIQRVKQERELLLRRTEELRQTELMMMRMGDMHVEDMSIPGSSSNAQVPFAPQQAEGFMPGATQLGHAGQLAHVRDPSQDSGYTPEVAPSFGTQMTSSMGMQSSMDYTPAGQQSQGYAPRANGSSGMSLGTGNTLNHGFGGTTMGYHPSMGVNNSAAGFHSPSGSTSLGGGMQMDRSAMQRQIGVGAEGFGMAGQNQPMDNFSTWL